MRKSRLHGVEISDSHSVDISDDERVLIRLLVAGLGDRQIAVRMNVAERTLQRRLHTVMRRLEVVNRCQLGAVAALNGWVDGGSVGRRSTAGA